jgi:hypothetical protein
MNFSHRMFYGFLMFIKININYFFKSINQLIFVMGSCCVLLEEGTEFISII